MLQEFADLLAISGGDAFKARAHEKAARAVEGYPLEVDGLDAKGSDAIPAVGSHLARKILEFGGTGLVAELDEVHAKVLSCLRTLQRHPGGRAVVPPRSWGAALIYFTGSKAHCARSSTCAFT